MNYMKEVAKMLGVELYEEFNISFYKYIKYRLTEHGLEYFYEQDKKWMVSDCLNGILRGTYEIVKIQKPILDDIEKEYLNNIIKPWRDCVNCIFKSKASNFEYIIIAYCDKLSEIEYDMYLPTFEVGTMYKGMELGKKYTLKELGL